MNKHDILNNFLDDWTGPTRKVNLRTCRKRGGIRSRGKRCSIDQGTRVEVLLQYLGDEVRLSSRRVRWGNKNWMIFYEKKF